MAYINKPHGASSWEANSRSSSQEIHYRVHNSTTQDPTPESYEPSSHPETL